MYTTYIVLRKIGRKAENSEFSLNFLVWERIVELAIHLESVWIEVEFLREIKRQFENNSLQVWYWRVGIYHTMKEGSEQVWKAIFFPALLHKLSLLSAQSTSVRQEAQKNKDNRLRFSQIQSQRICLELQRHLHPSQTPCSIWLLMMVVMLIKSWHASNRNAISKAF